MSDNSASFSSAQLFAGKAERINLWLPIAFLFLAVFEIQNHYFPLSEMQRNFISKVLFLDLTHAVLALVLVLGTPELKKWVQESTGYKPWKLWLPMVSVGVLTFLFLALSIDGFGDGKGLKRGFVLVFLFKIFMPAFHMISQFKGISIAYIKKIAAASPTETQTIRSLEKRIHFGFGGLISSFVALLIFYGTDFSEFHLSFLTENIFTFRMSAVAANLIFILMLYYWASHLPKALTTGLYLFMARLFLLPLAGMSEMANIGLSAAHGIEYLFVYRHMVQRSSADIIQKKHLHRMAFAAMAVLFAVAWPWWIYQEKEYNLTMALIIAAVVSFGHAHYYLDRILFRMRLPATRDSVGRLFPGS